MGCFGASTIVGCISVIFFLDPLERVMKKSRARFSQQMVAVFHLFTQRRNCLAFGLSFYYLFQSAFNSGVFTKVINICLVRYSVRYSTTQYNALQYLDLDLDSSRIQWRTYRK